MIVIKLILYFRKLQKILDCVNYRKVYSFIGLAVKSADAAVTTEQLQEISFTYYNHAALVTVIHEVDKQFASVVITAL